jgi:ankyrin repeat protein
MRLRTGILFSLLAFGCSAAAKPLDPLTQAILANDLAAIRQSKAGVNTKAAHGDTPLMYAAAYGTLDAMKVLLEAGADVNAKSDIGATALMLCITDAAKAKLLISKGADVTAKSKPGRTALLIAAMSDGTGETVKLLVSKGANPGDADEQGINTLIAAAGSGNIAALKLALEKHVPVNAKSMDGATALIAAAGDGNTEAVKLLLAAGADVNAVSGDPFFKVKNGTIALGNFTPLIVAVAYGPAPLVKALLDAGAKVDVKDARGFTPLHLAVSSEAQDPAIVRMLLAKGAVPDVKTNDAESPGDWAAKFRNPQVMSLLKVNSEPVSRQSLAAGPELRASVQKSLDLLEKTSTSFAKEGGCVSCHNQNITSMTANVARSHGFTSDLVLANERTALSNAYFAPAAEGFLLRLDPPGAIDTEAYALFGLAADGFSPDLTTSAITRNLAMNQRQDGSWHAAGIARVPIEDSDITRTAMSLRCLQLFGMDGAKAEYTDRINRARAWLLTAKPAYLEESDMQLLGLKWSGASPAAITKASVAIAAKQTAAGGWSQNPNLPEDAYATGQALYALHEAGGISVSDPVYQKGVAYLLRTQLPDGSWHVRSRAPKFQPYFQGGFPHDHDQWISSAATGWATMALALAIEPSQRAAR